MITSAGVRLDELLDALGSESLRILTPTARLDCVVGAVVVADVDALDTLAPDTLALVPGIAPHAVAIVAALERAAAAGAAALAIREATWRSAMGSPAEPPSRLPLVGVPETIAWGELYAMLSAVLASGTVLDGQPSDKPLARLFAFADAVAVALCGAVIIEDPQAEVLAYSNVAGQTVDQVREEAILTRRVPLTEQNRAEYLELSRTTGPVRFNAPGEELPRLAVAIRAGEQILGFLWVIDHDATLAPDADERIVEAARMAAIQLLRARTIDDVGRRTRDDALRRLLDGEHDRRLRAAADLERECAVGVLAARRVVLGTDRDDLAGPWISDFLALSARVRFPDARCVTIGDVFYVVVGTVCERLRELGALGEAIIERSAGRNLQIGVGTAGSISELGDARRDADRALEALAFRGDDPAVATIDDVRSLAILAEIEELAAERPALLAGPVRAMLEPSASTPPWCAATLHAYFAYFGSLSAAAAALGIHTNTLRYRIARIAELFRLDLDDPDERLVLSLQLRLSSPEGTPLVPSHRIGSDRL